MGRGTMGMKRFLTAFATALAVSALAALAATVPRAAADGIVVAGNENCSDLIPGATELRVEPPQDGTFSGSGGFSVTIDVRTLTSDDPGHAGDQTGSQVFDFTATGGVVLAVAVKGGTDVNFYDYRPGGRTSGSGLHAPVNDSNQKFYGLSHISFCYGPAAPPPPPPTTPPPPPTTTPPPPRAFTPPAVCGSLSVTPRGLQVGKRSTIVARVRLTDGKPFAGARVRVRGAALTSSGERMRRAWRASRPRRRGPGSPRSA
jgi:hypothetical protein